MNITNFMTWFINQVVSIFTSIFNILQSIQFMNTNLLQVIITILILTSLMPLIITIAPTNTIVTGYSVGREQRRKELIQERRAKEGKSRWI